MVYGGIASIAKRGCIGMRKMRFLQECHMRPLTVKVGQNHSVFLRNVKAFYIIG